LAQPAVSPQKPLDLANTLSYPYILMFFA